jgi:hypothetical protein
VAQIIVEPEQVIVELTAVEQLFALSRHITIPTAAIVGAEIVAEPLPVIRGIRSPGLGIPGRVKWGT